MGRSALYEFSLLWVFPVVWEGARRKIDDAERVPELPRELRAEALVPRARAYWDDELESVRKRKAAGGKTGKRRASLANVIVRLSRRYIWFGMVMSVVQGLVTTVVRPLLIRTLVSGLSSGAEQSELLIYVALFVVALVAEGWSSTSLKHALSDYLGTIWFTAVGALLHRKALSIPTSVTKMEESSLLGNDVLRAYENLRFASILPMAVISLIGGIIVLIVTIGRAAIAGLAVMVVVLMINARIAKRAQVAEEGDLAASDERLSLMTEIITGIKAIKLSAWEDSFLELTREARKAEMVWLRLYRTLHQSSVQLGRAAPALCAAVSFIFMAVSGEEIVAADLFAALNVFLALRLPLIIIPESVTYVGGFLVSFRRLEAYLQLVEVGAAARSRQAGRTGQGADRDQAGLEPSAPEGGEYVLRGSFSWHGLAGPGEASGPSKTDLPEGTSFRKEPDEEIEMAALELGNARGFRLRGVDLTLPRGCKCAVVGPVGSGKSSLLAAIADELAASNEDAVNTFKHASIGYVPQAAFVLSGTIRDNITLCKELREAPVDAESRLQDALTRSALHEDLASFPQGLETAVGERGVTLSGGQKARLAVARALFAQPDLLLADDPLAAVDAAVAKHLVEQVFDDLPPGTTLVAAINQSRFLGHFDIVVQMDAGRIVRAAPVTPELLAEIKLEEFDHRKAAQEEGDAEPAAGGCASPNSPRQVQLDEPSVREQSSHLSSREGSSLNLHDEGDGARDLVEADVRNSGEVSGTVIRTYAKGMGYWNIFAGVLAGSLAYAVMALNDLWLAAFVKIEIPTAEDQMRFAIVYAAGNVAFLVFLMVTSVIFSRAGVRSSQHLHDHCMDRVLHAPITWFEATPSGRILSRFSTDIGIVDQVLSRFTDNLFQLMATALALTVVVCVLIPPVTAVIAVSGVAFTFQVRAVDRSMREIKREANLAMSPIQTILNESVNGRITLRSMRAEDRFEERFASACDAWNRQSFTSLSMVNMSMLASYGLSFFIATATGLLIVLGNRNPADSALALTYSLLVPYFALHTSFIYTIVQNALSSLERVLDFVGDSVPQEPEWRCPGDPMTRLRIEKMGTKAREGQQAGVAPLGPVEVPGAPDEAQLWPSAGAIEFHSVSLVYRPGLPPALRKVSFSIRGGERIGVVGRTGAGKSSLLAVMFRTMESTSGYITIDGIDTSTLGLVTLREGLSVVPQEPLLIRGTVRKNLAPFGGYQDGQLRDVLVRSGLVHTLEAAGTLLDMDVGSNASSLSAGQRQLLSFARTLLRPGVVRVFDEPTSNVDEATDAVLQRILRSQNGTTIVIAHRTNTILDSDRVLVMDHGKVVEFDSPDVLLANPKGHFYEMTHTHDGEDGGGT